ncbi:thermonuclease family protein [Cesiribacter sp. SM1]|uniref:thermonuclease family protein n=1 Tax=Cesiribacter sp. SM1 TaxID=2861196 RepID=UPI001CD3CA11|nr:thermonuclease family protein [Cesiribacter sp. SM1]
MKNKSAVRSLLLLFGLLLFISGACEEENAVKEGVEYKGRVVGVSDGDTFTLLTPDKQQIKVRLSEIDAPESAQPYGTRAKQVLSDLIFQKDITVVKEDIDRYGRLVGHIYANGTHVNRKLVQDGMAWVYRQYLKDQTLLQDEQQAKEAKRGLWSLPSTEQVPPWEWRKGNRTGNSGNDPVSNEQEFTCGSKTRCSQMTSCEEAMYYLKECGVTTLDGDGDGMPCEALCR